MKVPLHLRPHDDNGRIKSREIINISTTTIIRKNNTTTTYPSQAKRPDEPLHVGRSHDRDLWELMINQVSVQCKEWSSQTQYKNCIRENLHV